MIDHTSIGVKTQTGAILSSQGENIYMAKYRP